MSEHINNNEEKNTHLDKQITEAECIPSESACDLVTTDDKEDVNELPEDAIMEANQVEHATESSGDQLIDLGPKAAKVKFSQITVNDIENLIVNCSACGKQINHNDMSQIKRHLHLGILMCKECFNYYGDGEFSEDDAGYNYCRWCAKGGKLYGCDFCPNQFCLGCLRRNFPRGIVREIKEVKWKCYVCDPSPLKGKVKFCDLIFDYCKNLRKEQKAKRSKFPQLSHGQVSSDSEADENTIIPSHWLPFHICRISHLAEKLEKRMIKLKCKHEQRDKSSKQIVGKIEELITKHSKEIDLILKTIITKYEQYVKWKKRSHSEDDVVYVKSVVSSKIKNVKETTSKGNTSESINKDEENDSVNNLQSSSHFHTATKLTEAISSDILEENLSNRSSSFITNVDIKNEKCINVPIDSDDSLHEIVGQGSLLKSVVKDAMADQSSKIVSSELDCNGDVEKSHSVVSSCSGEIIVTNCSSVEAGEICEQQQPNNNLSLVEQVRDGFGKQHSVTDTSYVGRDSPIPSTNLPEMSNQEHLSKNEAAKKLLLQKVSSDSDSDKSVNPHASSSLNTENPSNNSLLHSQSLLKEPIICVRSVAKKSFFGKMRVHTLKKKMLKTKRKKLDEQDNENTKNANLSSSNISISSFSSSDDDSPSENNSRGKKACVTMSPDMHDEEFPPTCSTQDSGENNLNIDESLVEVDTHKSIETMIKDSAIYFNDSKLLIKPQVIVEMLALDVSKHDDIFNETKKLLKNTQKLLKRKGIKYDSNENNEDNQEVRCKSKGKENKVSKAKKKKLKIVDSDSGSFVLSSSEELLDTDKPENLEVSRMEVPNNNQLAKEILLKSSNINSSDSSSDSSDSTSRKHASKVRSEKENEEKSSKGEVTSERTSQSENVSDDDFEAPRKKAKHYKLLSIPLSEDSESRKSKKKSQKKEKKRKSVKRKIFSSDESENGIKHTESSDSESDSNSAKNKSKSKGTGTKKRRRIKEVSHSSNSSAKEDKVEDCLDNQDTPSGKGRKNIRKIISDKKLTDETKEAAQAEKERRKRVADRQKLYNQITDVDTEHGTSVTRKMVLEVNEESKEEVVEIHPDIVEKLKPHQVNGVKFMWECTIESLKRLETTSGSGCILAHCMGLGKTLQVIAFLYTIFTNKYVNKKLRTALIICPYNTVLNWAKEFEIWLEDAEKEINVFEMTNAKNSYQRKDVLQQWQDEGGVLILSYNIFRRLAEGHLPKASKKIKEAVHKLIVDPGPDIVVCDEGHILKNETSAVSKATCKLKTQRRIVLTGTPLQNNLKEYHCMVHFVKPHLLGTRKEFQNRFVNPLINGQCADSSQYDVKIMKKRVHILHKLLEGCVQRCDYSALTKFLPDKHEFVISVKLSENQIKMYRYFLDNHAQGRICNDKVEGRHLFTDYNALKNIWTHPYLCKLSYIRDQNKRINDSESDSMESFINDETSGDESEGNEVVCLDEQPGTSKEKDDSSCDEVIKTYQTRSRGKREVSGEGSDEEPLSEVQEKHWWDEFFSEEDKYKLELSGKMVLVFEILKECELIGDKLLIFSQSLLTLNMMEELLSLEDAKSQDVEDESTQDVLGSWVPGIDYFRMDGTTHVELRKRWIELFNDRENERARLFLISTKAGSLGTNLIGANRVILLDASWNPSHDVQAIFRVYRFGQVKPVYIYRLLAQGTMEEKIYDRQVTKLSLSCRVVDEQNIERHFNAADLQALYSFDPESHSNRPTPMVPKDRLMAELLIKRKEWIVTYHEHDSLLQNVVEDDLTEEERRIAWQEYENEKEGLINEDQMGFGDIFGAPVPSTAFIPNERMIDVEAHMNYIIQSIKTRNPKADDAYLLSNAITGLTSLQRTYQEKHAKLKNEKVKMMQRNEQVPSDINSSIANLENAIIRVRDCVGSMKMKQYAHIALIKAKQQQRQQEQQRIREQQQASPFNYPHQFPTNINAANTYSQRGNFNNMRWRSPRPSVISSNLLPRNTQNKFNQLRNQGITVTETSAAPGSSSYIPNRINSPYYQQTRLHSPWNPYTGPQENFKTTESVPIITEIDESNQSVKDVLGHNQNRAPNNPTSVTITEVE